MRTFVNVGGLRVLQDLANRVSNVPALASAIANKLGGAYEGSNEGLRQLNYLGGTYSAFQVMSVSEGSIQITGPGLPEETAETVVQAAVTAHLRPD